MAIKISIAKVLPEHQTILESEAKIAATVTDLSNRVGKGDTSVNYSTLAPRLGQDLAVGAPGLNTDNNYGDDILPLDRVAFEGFSISVHDESDNALNGLSDGIKNSLKALALVMDNNLYTKMIAAATPTGAVQTADFYSDVVDMSTAMDTAKVPAEDRFLCVTPVDYAKLLKTQNFVRFDATGNGSAISTGIVGEILGFKVVRSTAASVTESIGYSRIGAVVAWHGETAFLKETQALAMTDQYSISRKFGAKATQAGAMIFKWAL